MFLRILRDSFLRQRRRKVVVLLAVALGTASATALGDIALDVGDKMNRELKAFGANLVVLPRGGSVPALVGGEDLSAWRVPSYLPASGVLNVKDNFWKNNILGFAPILDVPASAGTRRVVLRGTWFERPAPLPSDAGAAGTDGAAGTGGATGPGGAPATTAASLAGVRGLNPFWSVAGRWPAEPPSAAAAGSSGAAPAAAEALLGRDLATALGVGPGAALALDVSGRRLPLAVVGVLTAGGDEDGLILAPLEVVQAAAGLDGRVSAVLVSALTTPESAVWERMGKSPRELPPAEFEKWSCTPFVSSIAFELERSWPGSEARVIRRVASGEGAVLTRASGLMALIAALAALGAALTVTSATMTGILERRTEIGLLKAMGAGGSLVVALFLSEAALLGLAGGLAGAAGGAWLARVISTSVFGAPVDIRPAAVLLALATAMLITLLGSLLPARRIAGYRPAEVLRGR
jgi:putative ABC transport system permease protein